MPLCITLWLFSKQSWRWIRLFLLSKHSRPINDDSNWCACMFDRKSYKKAAVFIYVEWIERISTDGAFKQRLWYVGFEPVRGRVAHLHNHHFSIGSHEKQFFAIVAPDRPRPAIY